LNCRDYKNILTEDFEEQEHDLFKKVSRIFAIECKQRIQDFDCIIEPMTTWINDRPTEAVYIKANKRDEKLNERIIDWIEKRLNDLGYMFVRSNPATIINIRFKYS